MNVSSTAMTTPGSPAAIEQGCTCPVIDNHYGEGMPYRDGPRFWTDSNCPIHTPKTPASDADRGE